ncbi:hypothetical protein DXV76_02170 [Rhodobacteraceae bacterium CCMM004]|nr:hypothetical protein DXV76_02170 [Rhodobacteraceae bacterium CCMM004]
MNSRIFPSETLPFLGDRRGRGGDPDTIDIRALARTFWKRRWWILAAMLVCGIATYLAVGAGAPVYTAQSKVILDPRKAQIITAVEVVADLDPSEQIVNGEIATLRSNLLLEEVIADLPPEVIDEIDPANAPPGALDTLIGGAKERLGLAPPPAAEPSAADAEDQRVRRLTWAVRQMLTVFSESDSYVIVIRIEAGAPVLAATLANAISEEYIRLQLDGRRDAVGQATTYLEERLETLRGQVEAAEAAVARYRAESLVTDGGTLDAASQQLASLNGQLIEARAARVEAEARYRQLVSVVESEGRVAAARIVTTPVIETLRDQQLALRQQDAEWAQSFDADHPRRVAIRNELNQIESDIGSELDKVLQVRRSDFEIAQLRETSLLESIAGTESRVLSITQNNLDLRQLEREADAARQTYESLLTRVTETRTQEQLQQPDAKLIERATVPGAPSAPRPKLMAALAATVGAMVMAAWVFFNEMTATTFRTAREVETETGLPVLSSIPVERWRNPRAGLAALRASPYGAYGERIRQLRTAILMRDGKDTARSILILSSAPGEGKTTTTLALAEMSALAGKSVIVIDADLRRSSLQKAFGWKMETDFADFIQGNATLSDAIYVPDDAGFDVLAANGPRADAAEELSATWLQPVVDELKRVYDVVLIDAPAVLAVSDALILAQVVDTRVYMVRWDSTPRAAVAQGLAKLAELRLPVSGMVLNKVDARRSPDPYAEGYTYEA